MILTMKNPYKIEKTVNTAKCSPYPACATSHSQLDWESTKNWIPAFAGMTVIGSIQARHPYFQMLTAPSIYSFDHIGR